MHTAHSYIDSGITAIFLYLGFRLPMLAATWPTHIMWGVQLAALLIGITTGILTIMNFLGYTPKWLKRIKIYFKNISK